VLSSSASKNPLLVNRLIKDALEAYISRKFSSPPSSDDITLDTQTELSRLNALLLSTFTPDEEADPSIQESLLVGSVILSHHPLICTLTLFTKITSLARLLIYVLRWKGPSNLD
jgi:hypothetical protein